MSDKLERLCNELDDKIADGPSNGGARMGSGYPIWASGGQQRACIIEHGDDTVGENGMIYEATFDENNDFVYTDDGTTVTFNSGRLHNMGTDVDIELRGDPRLGINHSF